MANPNLQTDLKQDWINNEVVMPADVNEWAERINNLNEVIPIYAATGNFYTATYSSNVYNLQPCSFEDNTQNVTPSSYIDGMSVCFKIPETNLAQCKININNLGEKYIKLIDNTNVPSNYFNLNEYILLKYDSENDWFYVDSNNSSNRDLSNLTETGEAHFAKPDLSNLSSVGLDKINQSKALETGNVSSDKDVYADIVKYAHSTFDKSKFEVTGSPVITNDGIASGLQPHNETRILLNDTFNVADKNFRFTFGGKLNGLPEQDITANAPLVDIRDSVNNKWIQVFQLKNGNIQMANSHYGGTSIYSSAFTPVDLNGDFSAELLVNEENIVLNFYQNSGKQTIQFAYQNKLEEVKVRLAYGLENAFPGSYDLKQCSLNINNIPVFSGNITGIDTIKPDDYTVVGSPVISADGIFENTYNKTNYIESTETFDLSSGKFKFQTLINYSGNQKTSAGIMGFISGNNRFAISYNWTKWLINIITDTTLSADFPASYNMPVLLTADCNGSTMQLTALDTNGVSRNSSIDVSSVDFSLFKEAIFKLQAGQWSITEPFKIDLNLTKLWINGNLIYQPCLKIPYTQSKTGSKIVDVAYRDRVQDMYEQFGYAPYYTIDETNNDFTLPMGEIYGFYEKYKNSINQLSDQRFQELLDLVYPIGRPVPEVNNYLAANEVWLEGAIVNIADYPLLYQKYGTKYGGDGVTTFGLIDARNKALFWGSPDGSVKYIGPGLPNIRGAFTFTGDSIARPINGAAREAFYVVQNIEHSPTFENTGNNDILKVLEFAFNASQYNPIYQDSLSGFVVPNSFQVRFKTRYK